MCGRTRLQITKYSFGSECGLRECLLYELITGITPILLAAVFIFLFRRIYDNSIDITKLKIIANFENTDIAKICSRLDGIEAEQKKITVEITRLCTLIKH